ncbi:SRPBCC family protein [Haloferax massiliensis]|uniref:Polyketide cyclase / dehydrase and lipid transport n=1 Tax=Haloferax massiliensis TaxID=1476858 RepID=A0A0D6JQA0_9EURY|nr:SRPBCC family protein [Haloferax massiliensis]CQR50092.1 Polyketide cyclase / dehydrase and lipid transport [Haloferax massiliensis]
MRGESNRTRTRVERTPDGRRLAVSRRISAPADAAWDVLVSVADWPDWGPSVSAVRGVDGRIEAGSRGEVRVAGVWVPFSIETCDDEARRWTWRVAGVRATGHRVNPIGLDRCEVAFEVPVLAGPYAAVCAVALRRIERLAARRPAGEPPSGDRDPE